MSLRFVCLALAAPWLLACGSSANPSADSGTNNTADASIVDAPPPDAPLISAICDDLPAKPTSHTTLDYVPSGEDFTFDAQGNLVSVSLASGALMKTPYGGPAQLAVPGISEFARGIRPLTSGELVIADPISGSLKKVAANGSVSTLLGGMPDPNGVVIGNDGYIYVTHGQGGEVRRVNADTGEFTTLVDTPNDSYDGIVFSLDYKTLYFNEEVGTVNALDIASGNVTTLATIPLTEILDGMTMDECGNLYVVEMAGVIWRVSPAGDVEEYYRIDAGFAFIPAVNFGSGVGGWRRDRLYIMNFDGGAFELDTGGVRGRREPHLASL